MKADRHNKKLYTLQQASRHVNDMAAVVVTSTKHGQQQISDSGKRGSEPATFLCGVQVLGVCLCGFSLGSPDSNQSKINACECE